MPLWMCRLGYAFLVIALILCIVGEAIPYWYYARLGNVSIYFGLWKWCTTVESLSSCVSFLDGGGAVNATRALEIIGIVAGIAALCVLRIRKHLSHVNQIAGGMAIFAGILMLIGTIVFGTDDLQRLTPELNLHVGFALCVVAGILSIIGGGLICTLKQEYDAV